MDAYVVRSLLPKLEGRLIEDCQEEEEEEEANIACLFPLPFLYLLYTDNSTTWLSRPQFKRDCLIRRKERMIEAQLQ